MSYKNNIFKLGLLTGIGKVPTEKLDIEGNAKATEFIGSGSQLTGVATTAQGVLADNSVQLTGETSQQIEGKVRILNELVAGSVLGDIVSLFADRIGASNMYGFGVESGVLYYKSGGNHDFYRSKNQDGTPNGTVRAGSYSGDGSLLTGVVKTTGSVSQTINSSIVEVLGTATTAIIRASSSAGARISLFQSGETSFIQSNKSTDSFGRIVMSGSGGQPLEFLRVRIDGSFTEKNIYHEGNLASSPTGVLADNSVQLTGETSQNIEGRLDLNDGGNSVFIGTNAGLNDDKSDNRNVGVGYQALYENTTGYRNTACGPYALRFNTTGYFNTANGYQALYFNTTGVLNTANGYWALYANTTGFRNAATGYLALNFNTSGYFNTANGAQAGRLTNSGAANETSNSSVYIGYDTRALASGDTNEIVIGSTAEGKGSNTVTLGNDSITDTYLKGNVKANSFIAPLITIVEDTTLTVSNSEVIIDAASQAVSAILPTVASVPVGKKYTVIAYDAANTITLTTSSSQQIRQIKTDTTTSTTLAAGDIYTVINTGTYWQIISKQ
jgi:hypothetical protein